MNPEIFKDMIKLIEFERFKMGMGKYKFAQELGMHYHTYNSFVKQDRLTHPKTGMLIINFLITKGVDVAQLQKYLD